MLAFDAAIPNNCRMETEEEGEGSAPKRPALALACLDPLQDLAHNAPVDR